MVVLRIITFTLQMMLIALFAFLVYIVWLVRKKVEESGIFYEIYSWLLLSVTCMEAYALLASLILLFALESSSSAMAILYLPWIFFLICIYKIGRKLWNAVKEFGISD